MGRRTRPSPDDRPRWDDPDLKGSCDLDPEMIRDYSARSVELDPYDWRTDPSYDWAATRKRQREGGEP